MRRPWPILAGLALLASLGVNAYLLARPGGPKPVGRVERYEVVAFAGAPPLSSPAEAACARELRVAARALANVEHAIAQRLTPEERFAGGAADPGSEERVAELLAEIWGDEYRYSVECRSRVCRVVVEGLSMGWMEPLQQDPRSAPLFDRFLFAPEAAYLVVLEEARSRGKAVLLEAIHRAHESPRVAVCKSRSPVAGTLRVRFELDADERLVAAYDGAVADAAIDRCLRDAVDGELAGITVPADVIVPDYGAMELYP